MISHKQVVRGMKTKVSKNREFDNEKNFKQKQKKHDKVLFRNLKEEKDDVSFNY